MKKLIIFIFFPALFQAQSIKKVTNNLSDLITILNNQKQPQGHWNDKFTIQLLLNQISFSNWQKGGTGAISGAIRGQYNFNYIKKNMLFFNDVIFELGFIKQEEKKFRKGGDRIEYKGYLNYKSKFDKWFYSSGITFFSQFTNGYKYTSTTEELISGLFAPANIFLGMGGMYIEEGLNFNIFPVTYKLTLVLNQNLANKGIAGVEAAIKDSNGKIVIVGENSRSELGFMTELKYSKKNILKNVNTSQNIRLYTDYLNNFLNFDINWEGRIELIFNKYITANIDFHLIYDDDVKIGKDEDNNGTIVDAEKKPRIQWKQNFGIGLKYSF